METRSRGLVGQMMLRLLLIGIVMLASLGLWLVQPLREAVVADVGDSWVYEVKYGSETTYWTDTVLTEETNSGVICARVETTFSPDPVRVAQGVEITLKESRGWRGLSDGDFRYREQKVTAASGYLTVNSKIVLSGYTTGHGQPHVLGETWSYHEHGEPSMGAYFDYDYDVVVADALESVTVPADVFNCYRVTHTDRATPSRVLTEWWDADGVFVQAPVKTVDNANFASAQTMELASYPTPEPTVVTNGATNVTVSSATLNGTLDDLGAASAVDVSFEWGMDASYGSETSAHPMMSTGAFGANLAGLAPGVEYHFRAKAVGDGTSYGVDRTFYTSECNIRTWHLTNACANGEPFAIDGDAYIKYNKFMSETDVTGAEANVLIGYRNGDGFGLFDDNDDAWWYVDVPLDVVTTYSNAGWQASIVYSSTPDPVDSIIGDLTVMIYKVNDSGQLHETLIAEQTLPIPAGQNHATLAFDNIAGPGMTTFDPANGDRIAVRLFGTIDTFEWYSLCSWDWADQLRVHFNSDQVDSTLTSPCGGPIPPVPQLATIALVGSGLAGLAAYVWVRRRKHAVQPV